MNLSPGRFEVRPLPLLEEEEKKGLDSSSLGLWPGEVIGLNSHRLIGKQRRVVKLKIG